MARPTLYAVVLLALAAGRTEALASDNAALPPAVQAPASTASVAVPPYDPAVERRKYVVVRSPRQVPEGSPLRDTVMNVQISLRIAKYYDGDIDGMVNPRLLEAVSRYRGDHPQDADASLRQAIEDEQNRLILMGLYEGEIDGLASSRLYEAMIKAEYVDSVQASLLGPPPASQALPNPPAETPPPVAEAAAVPEPGTDKPPPARVTAHADRYGGDVPKAAPRDGVVAQDVEPPTATPAQPMPNPTERERKRQPSGSVRL